MAPTKRTTVELSTMVTRSSKRVTRSSTRQAKPISETPKKNKAKTTPKNPRKKKAKISPSEPKQEAEKAAETKVDVVDGDGSKKTIIVEHCKQCNSFKTRALLVKDGLEKGLDGGVNVVLNPEKPRRGCFEIREEGANGEKFISLLEMKRPFAPMKALDMEKVVSDILDKIKG